MPAAHRPGPPGSLPPGRARRPLVLSRPLWNPVTLGQLTLVAAVVSIVGTIAGRVLLAEPLGIDQTVAEATASGRTDATVALARALTVGGDLWFAIVAWLALVTIARRRSGRGDLAWLITAIVWGATLVTAVLKELTLRARPTEALVEAHTLAFPSGHATRGAALWGLIAWLVWRWMGAGPLRWASASLAVLLGLGAGLSRIVLGIHWVSDVIGGFVVGVVWLATCLAVTRPRPGVPRSESLLDDLADRLSGMLLGDRDDR